MKVRLVKGFTLIELLIAIAILGVLAAAVLAALNPIQQIKKANDARRKSDLAQIKRALEIYYNDNQRYPTTAQFSTLSVPYIAKLPTDPSSPAKQYGYKVSASGQTYYLYASLDRGGLDPQACNSSGTACTNATGVSCGAGKTCNYGVTSSDTSP